MKRFAPIKENKDKPSPHGDKRKKPWCSNQKRSFLQPMLKASNSGLLPAIIASLAQLEPLLTERYFYDTVNCRDGRIVGLEYIVWVILVLYIEKFSL